LSKIDLNLYTSASKEGDQYKITDIPPKLWAQFVERAKTILPEHGDNAWSAFLGAAITSVCDGNSHTFIMTDIPADAKVAMDEACTRAHCRADQVIGQLYRSAQLGKIHLLNITDAEQTDETHTMVIVGLPDKAWAGWDAIGQQANVETGHLLGMMIEAAGSNNLRLSGIDQRTRPPGIPEHPNGNKGNPQQSGVVNGNTGTGNNTGNGDNRGGRSTSFVAPTGR